MNTHSYLCNIYVCIYIFQMYNPTHMYAPLPCPAAPSRALPCRRRSPGTTPPRTRTTPSRRPPRRPPTPSAPASRRRRCSRRPSSTLRASTRRLLPGPALCSAGDAPPVFRSQGGQEAVGSSLALAAWPPHWSSTMSPEVAARSTSWGFRGQQHVVGRWGRREETRQWKERSLMRGLDQRHY